MAVLDKAGKYAVQIQTPKGPAIIESVEQWNKMVELGEYLAKLRSNRVGSSNQVRVSAVISNSSTVA